MADAPSGVDVRTIADPSMIMPEIVRLALRCDYCVPNFGMYMQYGDNPLMMAHLYRAWVRQHTWAIAVDAATDKLVGFVSIEHVQGAALRTNLIAWLCVDVAWTSHGVEGMLLQHAHTLSTDCVELQYDAELDMALLQRLRRHGYGMPRLRALHQAREIGQILDVSTLRAEIAAIVALFSVDPDDVIPGLAQVIKPDQAETTWEQRTNDAHAAIDGDYMSMDEFCRQFPEFIHNGHMRTIRMTCVLQSGSFLPAANTCKK